MDGQLLWTEVWRTQSEKATAGPCPGASAVQLELQAADGGGSCLGARERGRERERERERESEKTEKTSRHFDPQ